MVGASELYQILGLVPTDRGGAVRRVAQKSRIWTTDRRIPVSRMCAERSWWAHLCGRRAEGSAPPRRRSAATTSEPMGRGSRRRPAPKSGQQLDWPRAADPQVLLGARLVLRVERRRGTPGSVQSRSRLDVPGPGSSEICRMRPASQAPLRARIDGCSLRTNGFLLGAR